MQPYYVRMKDGAPFGMAGLWERWGKGDAAIESCTVLTTDANALMRPIHERMPVILPMEEYRLWLDPTEQSLEVLGQLMKPYDAGELEASPVSTFVNSPKHDGPECIEPLASPS